MRLVRREQTDDSICYDLEFGVVGMDAPVLVVVTRRYVDGELAVAERFGRSGMELPDRLIDALALHCFRVVDGYVREYDGGCGTWTAADATRWLRLRFEPADAERVIRALSLQVTPGLKAWDEVVVGDDDVVMADDYR